MQTRTIVETDTCNIQIMPSIHEQQSCLKMLGHSVNASPHSFTMLARTPLSTKNTIWISTHKRRHTCLGILMSQYNLSNGITELVQFCRFPSAVCIYRKSSVTGLRRGQVIMTFLLPSSSFHSFFTSFSHRNPKGLGLGTDRCNDMD